MQQGSRLLDSRGEGHPKATDFFVESRDAMCDAGNNWGAGPARVWHPAITCVAVEYDCLRRECF